MKDGCIHTLLYVFFTVRHVTEPVIQVMNRVQLDDGEEDGMFIIKIY